MRAVYDSRTPLLTAAETLLGAQEAIDDIGIDASQSLRRCHISPSLLAAPTGYLPYHQVVQFLNDVASRYQCPEFGFLVGKHQPPMRYGPAGQLPRFCATMREAILLAKKFSLTTSEMSIWELECDESYCVLKRRERLALDMPLLQIHTLTLTTVFKSLKALAGSDWRTHSISLMQSRPAYADKMSHYFGCPIYFNALENSIVFPSECLNIPIVTADKSLLDSIVKYFELEISDHPVEEEFSMKVMYHIKRTLGTSQCNLDSIAQLLGQSPRALQRTLKANNSSFRLLLSSARAEMAKEFLRSSDITLVDIADILGYRNVSAFSRAFKSSTGYAPDHWRQNPCLVS